MRGTITTWNQDRGFGWVRGEDCNLYFVHASAVAREQHERIGPRVRCIFRPTSARRGLRAEDVTLE